MRIAAIRAVDGHGQRRRERVAGTFGDPLPNAGRPDGLRLERFLPRLHPYEVQTAVFSLFEFQDGGAGSVEVV